MDDIDGDANVGAGYEVRMMLVMMMVMGVIVRMVLTVTVPGAGGETVVLNDAWLVDPGCMVSVCVWMTEMTVCTILPVDL